MESKFKSPFYVVEEFVSPLLCEELLDRIDFLYPNEDKDGFYVKTTQGCESAEAIVYERILALTPKLEQYYNIKYKGTERILFEWFTQGCRGDVVCENAQYLRKKWLRTRNRDLTGVLFLSDYQEKVPFESNYEVYGGKLEFPQHRFGFNPQRGTLIIFPSDPHFLNATSEVYAGDLFQARIQISAQTPYIYQPDQFPGNYTVWF